MSAIPTVSAPGDVPILRVAPAPEPSKPNDELEAADDDLALEIRRDDDGWLDPSRWLRGPTATAFALLAAGVTGLFVMHQALGVIGQIQAMPMPWQWGGWVLLGLGLAAIGYASARLGGVYIKLRASPKLSGRALHQLAERAELRRESDKQLVSAKRRLRKLLADHKFETAKGRRELFRLGFDDRQIEDLIGVKESLLATASTAPAEAWLRDYRTQYVGALDRAAGKLIRRRALFCGAKTAALPNGGIDTAVVLAHSYLLVADLCRLYHVRADRRGTSAILWRVLVGVLVAGQLEDALEAAGDQIGELAGGASTGILARAGSAMAGKVVGKAAEGMVNAAFLYRLGRATVRRLRPID